MEIVLVTFGAMSTWDVSAVTDMTDAFKEKLLSMQILVVGM